MKRLLSGHSKMGGLLMQALNSNRLRVNSSREADPSSEELPGATDAAASVLEAMGLGAFAQVLLSPDFRPHLQPTFEQCLGRLLLDENAPLRINQSGGDVSFVASPNSQALQYVVASEVISAAMIIGEHAPRIGVELLAATLAGRLYTSRDDGLALIRVMASMLRRTISHPDLAGPPPLKASAAVMALATEASVPAHLRCKLALVQGSSQPLAEQLAQIQQQLTLTYFQAIGTNEQHLAAQSFSLLTDPHMRQQFHHGLVPLTLAPEPAPFLYSPHIEMTPAEGQRIYNQAMQDGRWYAAQAVLDLTALWEARRAADEEWDDDELAPSPTELASHQELEPTRANVDQVSQALEVVETVAARTTSDEVGEASSSVTPVLVEPSAEIPVAVEFLGSDLGSAAADAMKSCRSQYNQMFGPRGSAAAPFFSMVQVTGGTICRASVDALVWGRQSMHLLDELAASGTNGAQVAAAAVAALMAHEAMPPLMRLQLANKLAQLCKQSLTVLPTLMQVDVWKALRTSLRAAPLLLELAPDVDVKALGPTVVLSPREIVDEIRQAAPDQYALLCHTPSLSQLAVISLATGRDGEMLKASADALVRVGDWREVLGNLAKAVGPAAAGVVAAALLTQRKLPKDQVAALAYSCCGWLASAHMRLPKSMQQAIRDALEQTSDDSLADSDKAFLLVELGPDLKLMVAPKVIDLAAKLKVGVDPARLAAMAPQLQALFLTVSAFTVESNDSQIVVRGKANMLKTEAQVTTAIERIQALADFGAFDLVAVLSAALAVTLSANSKQPVNKIASLLRLCNAYLELQQSHLPKSMKEALASVKQVVGLPADVMTILNKLVS